MRLVPTTELLGATDVGEEVGHAGFDPRVEQACEGIHHIVRSKFTAMVKADALAQRKCPRQPVTRGSPKFRQRRRDGKRLVE